MKGKHADSYRKYASLSIKDLLDAREAYHIHLTHLEHVVATAIGKYRFIRETDENKAQPSEEEPRGRSQRRTMLNSEIREQSVPALLVFVDYWMTRREMERNFDNVVPNLLYLPDGRVVPTCVIYAEKFGLPNQAPPVPRYPDYPLAGSFPVFSDAQGTTRMGTVGCLVTNGERYFALTNQHVIGEPQHKVQTIAMGQKLDIGKSDSRQLVNMKFSEAYPGSAGMNTLLTVDAGLVDLDDINNWTAQVYGIGQFGELVDLHKDSLTLDLIGRETIAWGAASCRMHGVIQALFYRHRTVGGQESLADFLIGPFPGRSLEATRRESLKLTQHGNSGAVWFLIEKDQAADQSRAVTPSPLPRPIAIHWGGQRFVSGSAVSQTHYALATALSTICRELNVDIVRDLNVGLPQTWGALGHYKIAEVACQLLDQLSQQKKLKRFFKLNYDRITYKREELESFTKPETIGTFFPLADVPDYIWAKTPQYKPYAREAEGPNHYANVDVVWDRHGETLLRLCLQDSGFLDPAKWKQYFDEVNARLQLEKPGGGTLPFRVWQLFDAMVKAVTEKRLDEFLLAAGVLAHYTGDACNSLHASWEHTAESASFKTKLHPIYDTDLFAPKKVRTNLMGRIDTATANAALKTISSGQEAALAIMTLIDRSQSTVPPKRLHEIFFAAETAADAKYAIWDELGDAIAERFVEAAMLIASLWHGAWKAGDGEAIAQNKIAKVDYDTLEGLYNDQSVLPSVDITRLRLAGSQLTIV